MFVHASALLHPKSCRTLSDRGPRGGGCCVALQRRAAVSVSKKRQQRHHRPRHAEHGGEAPQLPPRSASMDAAAAPRMAALGRAGSQLPSHVTEVTKQPVPSQETLQRLSQSMGQVHISMSPDAMASESWQHLGLQLAGAPGLSLLHKLAAVTCRGCRWLPGFDLIHARRFSNMSTMVASSCTSLLVVSFTAHGGLTHVQACRWATQTRRCQRGERAPCCWTGVRSRTQRSALAPT